MHHVAADGRRVDLVGHRGAQRVTQAGDPEILHGGDVSTALGREAEADSVRLVDLLDPEQTLRVAVGSPHVPQHILIDLEGRVAEDVDVTAGVIGHGVEEVDAAAAALVLALSCHSVLLMG